MSWTIDPREPKMTIAPSVVSYTVCKIRKRCEREGQFGMAESRVGRERSTDYRMILVVLTLFSTSESMHARLIPSDLGFPHGGVFSDIPSYAGSHSSPHGPYDIASRSRWRRERQTSAPAGRTRRQDWAYDLVPPDHASRTRLPVPLPEVQRRPPSAVTESAYVSSSLRSLAQRVW